MTPHQLAEIIRRAHAIGERKENQVSIENYPREWKDMIVAALRAVPGPMVPWELRCQRNVCSAPECDCPPAVPPGWIDAAALQAAREIAAITWTYTSKVAAIQGIVAREMMRAASQVPSTQENVKPNVAALEAFGAAQAPVITDEMLNAHIKALGDWAEAFTAERESGVPVDCDISQEDADFFNEEERKRLRIGYEAALAVTSTQEKPLREGQAAPERNDVYLAAKEGNLQFWRAQAAQEKAYNTWKSEVFIGECPQLMKGTLVDYIADAVMSSLVPSTWQPSFCSRCGGKDPDCYICGTAVASTEGK
jgi:hypothetical protein